MTLHNRSNDRGTEGTSRICVDDAREAARDREQGRPCGPSERVPRTNGRLKKLDRPAARAARSAAADVAGSSTTERRSTPDQMRRTRAADDRRIRRAAVASRRRVRMGKRVAMVMVVALTSAATASAQSSRATPSSQSASRRRRHIRSTTPTDDRPANADTRPATTTINGDTGLVVRADGRGVAGEEVCRSARTG